MQLEFAALSRATGNETYNDLAERALKVVFDSPHRPGGKAAGLFQTQWSLDSGTPTSDRVGTGGASDSFYEYLLKARWDGMTGLLRRGRKSPLLPTPRRAAPPAASFRPRCADGGASVSVPFCHNQVWVLGGRTPELQDYRTRWVRAREHPQSQSPPSHHRRRRSRCLAWSPAALLC